MIQTRKYGITESIIQALNYDFFANYVIIKGLYYGFSDAILSRLVTIIKRLVHHAVYCISLSCLLSFLCNPYIPFLIYEIFYLYTCYNYTDAVKNPLLCYSCIGAYISFMGETLPNHAYVDISLVGNADDGSDSVQCHTDLVTCCSGNQGDDRGDWYLPSGDRLGFTAPDVVFESRVAQRVDLRRRNNADRPSGVYRCDIETIAVNSDDNMDRETVYAGLYATGGKLTLLLQLH